MCDPVSAVIGLGGALLGGMMGSSQSVPEPPQMPEPTPLPPPPQQEKAPDPMQMGKEFEDQQKNSGQISTWLTGSKGALVDDENKRKNTLLGG